MLHCLYCGKEIAVGEYCCDECRGLTQDFQDSVDRNAKWFVLGIILSLLLFVVPYVTGNDAHITLMFIAMGLTLIVFPYVTPETNAWRGVKTGKLIGRLTGFCMAFISLVCLVIWM